LSPNPAIDSIPYLSNEKISIEALRLDQIHPIVSGNKWYKLRYYIKESLAKNATTIASFGGPYSNHLVALAFIAKENGLKSIGYVRANEGEHITPTLQEAMGYGMKIIFGGRTEFQEKKNKLITQNHNGPNDIYFVDEGGYGELGAKGAATIINDFGNKLHAYDYIICAVGTGTMIAGIISAATINQKIIGIPVLKNEGSIRNEILNLLQNKKAVFELLHTFHQGGYAKTTKEQIEFMNRLWENAKMPSDIVYTGKVFYAVEQLVHQTYFKTNSKVLVIHSGGLQGNRSLDKGVLNFD
jgi:1-aminocyclopropane-1-carboxylate deaminase